MYKILPSNKFLKDAKLLQKRSPKDLEILEEIVDILANYGHKGLQPKHKAHKLSGNYSNYWECHVRPNLLLIWDENEVLMLIELVRTGTHSDLF
ncbi:type II toxin-antitoxin system YafQ family toxin [Pedobacter sp. SL55]|uniref:type II toxin-antitoxin system RelE/ParE family toxin n=1 Tax=Pedobacter sp. SL55 TaxID=2995161 RepID=UPI002270057E|nr:type II toxin-antitoxin system YafQ family toxin [Pedobacter sp. SL55]WAC39177.1 type II toxin-antitoxin system YafQ family toxin [Pedobacter sp. SL55]